MIAMCAWRDANAGRSCLIRLYSNATYVVDLYASEEHLFSRSSTSLSAAQCTAEGLRRVRRSAHNREQHPEAQLLRGAA